MIFLRGEPDLVIDTTKLAFTETEVSGIANDDAITALLGTVVSGGTAPYTITYEYAGGPISYPTSPLAGDYDVTIKATDADGNVGSEVVTITVTV